MFPASFATLATTLLFASACQAGILFGVPDNYLIQLKQMSPGDTLELMPGECRNGLPIHGINGQPGQRMTIAGPASWLRPVFMARGGANTVGIVDSSYITIRIIELDGLNMAGIDSVKTEGHTHWADLVTLENHLIRNHGSDHSANAAFAATPISGIKGEGNITAPLAKADDYLIHPLAWLGTFDPLPGRLTLAQSAQAALPPKPDANLDFDGRPPNLPVAGAYNSEGGAPVWLSRLERKQQ